MICRTPDWKLLPAAFCFITLVLWSSSALAAGTFRFPLFYVPTNLDPVKDELVDTYHIVQQVYDGLVAFDSNLRVIPGLAESWTVSRDGRTYVFKLRKDIRFHNGKEVTAEDVVASLTRLVHPDNDTSAKEYLYRIKGAVQYKEGKSGSVSGIRKKSDTEVVIEMLEPYAPFLSVLAMPVSKIVPHEMIDDPEQPLGRTPVGTGAFRFESWKDGAIVLKANKDYFAGEPLLDEIRFIFYPAEKRDEVFPDFLAGKLEACPIPGSADLGELRSKNYQVLVRPRLSIMFYGMNIRKPPMDDPELRRALMLALDRATLFTEVMGTRYPAAEQILPPGMPGYSPENALAVYNPDAARNHLDRSRYPEGKGLPEITLASVSHSSLAKNELELFRRNLETLGVRLKPIFVETWEEFKKGIEEGRYHLFRYALNADFPDPEDLLPSIVETGGSHNFTGYGKSEVDRLIQQARGEMDPVKRITLYREVERLVLDDPPLIPVIFLSTQVAFQKNIQNIDLPATGTPYLPLNRITVADSP